MEYTLMKTKKDHDIVDFSQIKQRFLNQSIHLLKDFRISIYELKIWAWGQRIYNKKYFHAWTATNEFSDWLSKNCVDEIYHYRDHRENDEKSIKVLH